MMIAIMCCFLPCIAISYSKVCTQSQGVVICCPGYVWNRIENRCVYLAYDITSLKHQNVYSTPQTTSFNNFTRQANSSIHQEKHNEKSKTYGLLKYFILSLLVITFILCLLYVRLVFRCRFPHS